MKTKIILTIFCSLYIFISIAQRKDIKEVKIGDTIPQSLYQKLEIGSKDGGKAIIINFWATWCGSCLKELPILDSLAKKNADKLIVFVVTYQGIEEVNKFFANRLDIKLENVKMIVGDKFLTYLFPHKLLPHNIWIDKNKTVRGISSGNAINQNNIELLKAERKIKGVEKLDRINFDSHVTFHQMDSNFIYRSLLTGYAKGVPGGTSYMTENHPTKRRLTRFFTFNSSIRELLWAAINRKVSFKDYYGVMQISTRDSTKFFYPNECPQSFAKSGYENKEEWMARNLYCYELTLPFGQQDTLFFDNMLNDIKRSFKLDVRIEEKKILCAIIEKRGEKWTSILSNRKDTSYIKLDKNSLEVVNVPIRRMFEFLNEEVKLSLNSKPSDPPIVDKTMLGNIDLFLKFDKINPSYEDIKRLIKDSYDISVVYREENYPIVKIKDLEP